MPRENNFLIGQGERLTYEVEVATSGGQKASPYDFATQKARLNARLSQTNEYIRALPVEACPGDKAVAVVTMHPRFISKSDFPEDLIRSAGLQSIGSRSTEITPESWGVRKHPERASTDQLFVMGTRTSFPSGLVDFIGWRNIREYRATWERSKMCRLFEPRPRYGLSRKTGTR